MSFSKAISTEEFIAEIFKEAQAKNRAEVQDPPQYYAMAHLPAAFRQILLNPTVANENEAVHNTYWDIKKLELKQAETGLSKEEEKSLKYLMKQDEEYNKKYQKEGKYDGFVAPEYMGNPQEKLLIMGKLSKMSRR